MRTKLLQVRISEEEENTIRDMAGMYDVDVSTLIRTLVAHVNSLRPRPTLTDTITIAPLETDNGKGQVSKHQSSD